MSGRTLVLILSFVILAISLTPVSACTWTGQPYTLTSDTIHWTLDIKSGENCIRGIRLNNVVLANLAVVVAPRAGRLNLLGSGFSYEAADDFQGTDSFSLSVSGAIKRVPGKSTIEVTVTAAGASEPSPSKPSAGKPSPSEPSTRSPSAVQSPISAPAAAGPALPLSGAGQPCPYTAVAALHGVADDGCSDAPKGTPQFPTLLNKYGSHRPPWNVAGVDYYVGVPADKKLTPWYQIRAPGVSVSTFNGDQATLTCDTGNVALDGIDFGAVRPAGDPGSAKYFSYIFVPSGGCTGLSVTNSRFGCASDGSRHAPGSYFLIQSKFAGTLTFKYNTLDFVGCEQGWQGGNAATLQFVSDAPGGSMVVQYNMFRHIACHPVAFGAGGGPITGIDYRFNVLDTPAMNPVGNCHQNWQQVGGGPIFNDNVSFNTAFIEPDQKAINGGEGFQFYTNFGGDTTNPIFANNTIIPLCCMANVIHGTGVPPGTKVVGVGINKMNYFDMSAATAAYYPGSMTGSSGWTSSGNINMMTGAAITPQ